MGEIRGVPVQVVDGSMEEGFWVSMLGKVLDFRNAAVLPGDRLLLGSRERGIILRDRAGNDQQLVGPDEATGFFFASPSGRYVVYYRALEWAGYPAELDFAAKEAWGLYDLADHSDRVLVAEPVRGSYVLGWLGDSIVFHAAGDLAHLWLLDLDGTVSELAHLEGARHLLGIRNGLLPYEADDGSVQILDLETLEVKSFPWAKWPAFWSKDCLAADVDGMSCLLEGSGPGFMPGEIQTWVGRPADYLGERGGRSVQVLARPGSRWAEVEGEKMLYVCRDAVLLPDGSLVVGLSGWGAMARYATDGTWEELLGSDQTSAEVKLDPTGRYIAYGYPLALDGSYVLRAGVGLYDLETKSRSLLAQQEGKTVEILGWLGDKVVVGWLGPDDPIDVALCDLGGNVEVLGQVSGSTRFLRVKDGILPYETTDGNLVLLNLRTWQEKVLPGATEGAWLKDGLQVLRGGARETIKDLSVEGP